MARIELKQLAHSYLAHPGSEDDYALKRLDHVWQDGGAYALLGPSGCGKTTLLNLISGLLTPSEGRVLFDGKDVTPLTPEQRNIAQVFQFPVIYDTMTVYENLAFPLRNRKVPESHIKERVAEVADMLELTRDLQRRARGLAADAKQRISMGRGLVRSDVAAILFDEPLTTIDPNSKWLLRRKLKQIHERFKLTLVYVTHDQNEALTFADTVVVMNEGRVLQMGTPQDLFEAPRHTFVGYFIGSPGMNFMACELDGDDARVDGQIIPLSSGLADKGRARGGAFKVGIRPEFLKLDREAAEGGLPVRVLGVENLGNYQMAKVRLGTETVNVKAPEGRREGKLCIKIFVVEKTEDLVTQIHNVVLGEPVDIVEIGEIRSRD